MKDKRCFNCKFWATVDFGYSNYTVIDTEVHCLKNHFEPTKESYSWYSPDCDTKDHEFVRRAETCSDYKKGEGIRLDVDGELTIEYYYDDKELYNAAKKYEL